MSVFTTLVERARRLKFASPVRKGGSLKQASEKINGLLLSSAAGLASAETVDQLLRELCSTLADSSGYIRIVQLFRCEAKDPEVLYPLCAHHRNAQGLVNALSSYRDEVLLSVAHEALADNLPVMFRPRTDINFAKLANEMLSAGIQAGVVVPFPITGFKRRTVMVLLADHPDFFDRIGLEPFSAYARLCGVLLDQTIHRQKLREYATFDHLTGLLNRRALLEILEREHVRAERNGDCYSVLFFDLDFFKQINDTHGHMVGDRVLQWVAQLAGRALREGDWVGRWGGEEFICILPDASESEAVRIAQRLRTQIGEATFTLDEGTISVTLSIGVACYPNDGTDIDTLLGSADAGLAEAKSNGRNCVRRSGGDKAL